MKPDSDQLTTRACVSKEETHINLNTYGYITGLKKMRCKNRPGAILVF